ncbi:MAG: glycerophosphodiester phosphodiesterase [Prevotella sp.]|nr:glycerophosphodiester phosphodiesterase [Prevotella sp.]MCH4186134.1 glycerophosphodiester phosphodiesterase [Prevotella sp.]MCH4215885.1 glycerophosphodiester phosphodiesterase [Prevotella sp.]MCI1292349.1 glycerophosphodiester phosphodiesterase [Prevotella sp.]MCI1449939.1 glycerophosphodiester phosphodiesterase [Prevotella sp.]
MAVCLISATGVFAKTRVIAHRGYWRAPGAAQNSLASLEGAHRIGAYGSEFDVHITQDGVVMVNHDRVLPDGTNIELVNYQDLKKEKLANGEPLPTLRSYLREGKKLHGTQMILEVKAHITPEAEDRCIDSIVNMVKEYGMKKQVEYISFSQNACKQLARKAPKHSRISYLGGDLSPEEAKAMGCTGIDYDQNCFVQHPEWIADAHKAGMTVNVWTVDHLDKIKQFINEKVDFITTNHPVEALKLSK